MVKQLGLTAVAACMALTANIANAGSTDYWFAGNLTQLSDDSAEYLIKGANALEGDTIVEAGDRLRGIFQINSGTDLTGGNPLRSYGSGSGYNELTGIFDITVAARTGDDASGYNWVFAPTAGFTSTYGAGAMVAFFSDPVFEFDRTCAACSIASLEANVTDVPLFMAAGINGGGNEYWVANASTKDISVIGSSTPPTALGGFNAALDLTTNNTGYAFNTVLCGVPGAFPDRQVDMCGSGSLLGTLGAQTPYDSFDNVDFVMERIPEPATLGLLGAGLVLLARTRRRNKA